MSTPAAVDNSMVATLQEVLASLGLGPFGEDVLGSLGTFAVELLRWNAKVNLTAIVDPREVAEKHLADSLCALPEVQGACRVLDLGAGAGFPGIPLALAQPLLSATLVDTVGKKVAFMKHGIAHLKLVGRVSAVHARAEGDPAKERLPQADVVISRALMDLERWLPLARPYLAPGGRIVAMLGRAPDDAALARLGQGAGATFMGCRRYELPRSREQRAIACFT